MGKPKDGDDNDDGSAFGGEGDEHAFGGEDKDEAEEDADNEVYDLLEDDEEDDEALFDDPPEPLPEEFASIAPIANAIYQPGWQRGDYERWSRTLDAETLST